MLRLDSTVIIAPLQTTHANSMLRWMLDKEVAANVGLRQEASLEKTLAWIQKAIVDVSICGFAILWKERHVGNVVLDLIDPYLSSARLSVYVGEADCQAKGIGRMAVFLALQHGFANKRLHKIWLTTHAKNYRALNCYSKLGFRFEGILRDEFWLEGKRMDLVRMSLLQSEFALVKIEENGQ